MAGQIIFFNKSVVDFSQPNISATASQGADYAEFALNRNNSSAWITTGSVDADNTTWEVTLADPNTISELILVEHNFKNFTIQYWDGSAYQNFSTPISQTNNTDTTNRFSFNSVEVFKIKITITATMVANADKYMYQFIATSVKGQLAGWPVIQDPVISKTKQKTQMLSGKLSIAENIESFSCKLRVDNWKSSADLAIVESLYASQDGFLVWLCGGSESQFSSTRKGYRKKDIFLMKCVNEHSPEWVQGLYQTGMTIQIDLSEVVG